MTAAIFSLAAAMMAAPAVAQTRVQIEVTGPHNPYCGAWQNGTWVPNGNCIEESAPTTSNSTTTIITTPQTTTTTDRDRDMARDHGRSFERIRGTITSVNGHMVTIQQSDRSLVINDSPALAAQNSGRVAVGRQVTVHGYWEDGQYFATRLE
ncbi:MAG: DUF5666 domain-containing protein [Vulcanimicrobiaceae bacterium]